MRILLADDDSKIHLIVKMWFQKNGHEVTSAYNGQEAFEMISKDNYDVLISDVNMPLMKGYDLVKKVKQLSETPRLVVLLTSRCDLKALAEDINWGRVHFLNKPFSPSVLADLVEELMAVNTI